MHFWTDGLQKRWLDECLKSAVSMDPSTSNMVNAPKHCYNLKDNIFTIFIDQCGGNSVAISLSYDM